MSHRLVVLAAGAAIACTSAPRAGSVSRPEEDWVATTCSPASPDTTGWRLHQFADLEIRLPSDFRVRSPTTRSVEFTNGPSVLSLAVGASATRAIFFAAGRPARAKEEAGCETTIGGYPSAIMTVARANAFTVNVEWDGEQLWGPDDWRKRLIASVHTSRLRDAWRLRDALHTIRPVRVPPP